MTVIDGAVTKGRHIVILEALQQQVLKQLHINHMGIKKTKLLACESVYWMGINVVIESHIKIVLHALTSSKHNQQIHHNITGKPWYIIGVDMFTLNNKNYLCIVDYHSKFPTVKKAEDISADSSIVACKVTFQNMDC